MGMGSGTLPLESFKHYLVQDYLYLVFLIESSFVHLMSLIVIQVHFARSNALASYKGKTMESVAAVRGIRMSFSTRVSANNTDGSQSARIVLHIEREMSLHVDYCASFGLSKADMENTPETNGE